MALGPPPPKFQAFDANGDPLVGGKVYTYVSGTSTPLATYTNSGGGTPNANPVILDSRGEANIWLDPTATYRFTLATSADATIWTVDGITGNTTNAILKDGSTTTTEQIPFAVGLRCTSADAAVTFAPTGTGTVTINPATLGNIDNTRIGATTPATARVSQLTISTSASKIIPGATSLSLRDNADSADNLIVTDAGNVTIRAGLTLATGGAFAISSAGALTSTSTGSQVFKGPLDISATTSGQIKFPASQNASSNANTLDDYEEGTWTPIIASAGGGTATYTGQSGSYTKIGREVTVHFNLTMATKGTLGAGPTSVGGLPFASLDDNSARGAASVLFGGTLSTSFVSVLLYAEKNTTSFPLKGITGAAANYSNLSVSDLSTTSDLISSISYPAAA